MENVFIGDRMIPMGPLKLEDFPPISGNLHFLDGDGVPKPDADKDSVEPGDLVMVEYPRLLSFYEVTDAGAVEYRTSVSNNQSNPERISQ